MITPDEARRLKDQLLAILEEDAHNTERLLSRMDSITKETGIGAHSALLLILTHLAFEDTQARRHWEAILAHRQAISASLGRDVGVRVAVLDYFMNVNRRLVHPTIIDLELFEAGERGRRVDPVTGLATERMFRASVQRELRRAKRYEQRVPVVLFDLDDFAQVNERFGELMGDRLLRETAILLHNKIRDIDLAARPGEDELALVLPETSRNGALLVAERFRSEVQSHFSRREVAGAPVGLTVSAGVACYPDDASCPEELLERAAQALYQAKAAGKNAVQAYQPERRRYLRFDLAPQSFEVEILAPREAGGGLPRNLSRNGIMFRSPERLEVGEDVEIRVVEAGEEAPIPPLRLRGRVVRLEELQTGGPQGVEPVPASESAERFEVGVALDEEAPSGGDGLLALLERAQARP